MTEATTPLAAADAGNAPGPSAGAMLRAAREAAGLSVDAVAQQLKLAPRQVLALEDGDFAKLPGRTFVRGFLRNYARLVNVNAEAVLAALASSAAPVSPALHATAPTIGELPASDQSRPAWARWLIPITLVAIIATAAIYEFTRGGSESRRSIQPPPAANEPEPPAAPKAASEAETTLANPLAAPASPAATPASTAAAPVNPAAAPVSSAAAPASQAAVPAGGEVPLVLTFRDSSWTEVRDATGRVLLSQMIPGGQSRTLAGVPPIELVIGNAGEASLSYRGKAIDLVPYTRQNVARVVLP